MKQLIIAALLVFSQISMAGQKEVKHDFTRETAKSILESKDLEKKEKYLSSIADSAGKAGHVQGLTENIKKALLQNNPDLLVLVYKSIEKQDEAVLRFIGDASAGVKTEKEAEVLAQLATLPEYAGKFKVELINAIENGSSVKDGMKTASKAIGKTGKDEITLEKFPCEG